MTDQQVIDALGGAIKVAQELDVNVEIVRKFKARGIGWKYRASIMKLARRKRAKIPEDFLNVQRAI